MENVSHEELHGILSLIKDWISNCDSKVSVLLSGLGIFAGIFLTSDYSNKLIKISKLISEENDNIDGYQAIILATFASIYVFASICLLILLPCGCWYLFKTITANVNSKEFKNSGIYSNSLIFFSSIAGHATLAEYRRQLSKCSKEQMTYDFISQIYVCSIICDQKFAFYNKGLFCSRIVLLAFIVIKITETCIAAILSTQS